MLGTKTMHRKNIIKTLFSFEKLGTKKVTFSAKIKSKFNYVRKVRN
jgi:hypothetical protein